jgi:hypothetical protein
MRQIDEPSENPPELGCHPNIDRSSARVHEHLGRCHSRSCGFSAVTLDVVVQE